MTETANILRYATSESLIVLDEVGRGTSTFDGLSLAWAIVEHLHERVGATALFATHYHELTELQALLDRVVNRTMAVKEWQDQIVFLHRVVDGSADKSYGIHVARLAGVPESVLQRANELLANLEAQEYDFAGKPRIARGERAPESPGPDQLGLFAGADEVVVSLLQEVDLDRLTPLAALNLLASLKERLRGGGAG
jgi:DNA mismatch repair protein MutS